MPNMVTQGVSNYLVPATSSPNAYLIRGTFSAAPEIVNFSNISLNGLAFRPSGVIIDNTAGTGPLNILIPEMSFNIVCPAGSSLNMPYPAPMNHTAAITGLGDATVIFVDYPLQPYSSAQAAGSPPIPNPLPVSVPNPLPVSGPATNAEMRATPIPVSVPNPLPVSFPVIARTPKIVAAAGAGNVPAGCIYVKFHVLGAAGTTVSIAGIAGIPSGYVAEFFTHDGETLSAIAYDSTGGTLLIDYVQ